MADALLRDALRQKAIRVKQAQDISLPRLEYWNYEPCILHARGWRYGYDPPETVRREPKRGCLDCGGIFSRHQRIGISWLYLQESGILADTVGTGKTWQAIGLACLLKERGELTNRMMIVVGKTAALLQWRDEFRRLAPRLHVEVVDGNRSARIQTYCTNFDVLIVSQFLFLRDVDMIVQLDIGSVITDDVDPLLNDTATAAALKRQSSTCTRAIAMSGTPLQTRLDQLHSLLSYTGMHDFGSLTAFKTRYQREEPVTIWDHRTGRKRTVKKVVGYKNMNEFRSKLQAWYLRRTHHDLEDADLPVVVPNPVWLDLTPRQKTAYEELKKGVVQLLNEEGDHVTRAAAQAKLMYGSRICAGLEALGEERVRGWGDFANPAQATSCKFDWIEQKLTGDLADEKVVMFAQFKDTIRAMHKALVELGIGYETIWGEERDPTLRHESVQRFWNDRDCRVIIGTSAIEQSLNLQTSCNLVNIDTLLNPQRMEQLAGRIRRMGSEHSHVWVHTLLTRDTQEAEYEGVLKRRQALVDFVWNEESELYEKLSAIEMLHMIRP